MSRRRIFAVLLSLSGLLLGACASLNEQECRRGDWQQIGFRDGQAGRPVSRIEAHREACHEFGVEPQETAYRVGRERGLNFYCTPANGMAAGRRGERYAGVCPAWAERGFLRSFEAGREVYFARERLDRIEQALRSLEVRFSGANSKDDLRDLGRQVSRLRLERDIAWGDLRRREMEANSYRY